MVIYSKMTCNFALNNLYYCFFHFLYNFSILHSCNLLSYASKFFFIFNMRSSHVFSISINLTSKLIFDCVIDKMLAVNKANLGLRLDMDVLAEKCVKQEEELKALKNGKLEGVICDGREDRKKVVYDAASLG